MTAPRSQRSATADRAATKGTNGLGTQMNADGRRWCSGKQGDAETARRDQEPNIPPSRRPHPPISISSPYPGSFTRICVPSPPLSLRSLGSFLAALASWRFKAVPYPRPSAQIRVRMRFVVSSVPYLRPSAPICVPSPSSSVVPRSSLRVRPSPRLQRLAAGSRWRPRIWRLR